MIEIKPLHYFLAAYEEGSITAAASRCFIAQPSITHAIKSLESRLGVTLFERSKQGIKPTGEGKKLYKLATDLLLQNQHLEEAFIPDGKIKLYLYIQSDINIEFYSKVIEAINSISENIDLLIADAIEQAQIAIIDEERLPSQFEFNVIKEEGYKLLVRSDHPLAKKRHISLNAFEDLKFIERPYCTNRKAFERLTHENNISITYQGKAIHDLQLQGLVKLGLGEAVIPESYMTKDDQLAYITIKLDSPITRSIALAYRQLPSTLMQALKTISFSH
jgi:DNA-binding transcriptional LysR family regulator